MTHLGIIGMGYAGTQLMQAAESVADLTVAAVTDVSSERLQGLPDSVRVLPDWRALIDDAALDAVIICLPHAEHAEVTLAALDSGKHILLEKPLAATLGEAERIAEAAAASDCIVMVEMTHRFYPPMLAARALVVEGRLGQVYAVEDRIVQHMSHGRLPEWMLQCQSSGGGVAMTNGVHMLDRISWVCGQPLRFLSGQAGWTHNLGDVEDTAAMLLALADGTPAAFLATWSQGAVDALDDELTLYGTTGTLRVWSWRGWTFEPLAGSPPQRGGYPEGVDRLARVRLGMAGALTEFSQAIQEGRPASPGAGEILVIQRLLDEYYRHVGAIQ